jgi:hypothetical protein
MSDHKKNVEYGRRVIQVLADDSFVSGPLYRTQGGWWCRFSSRPVQQPGVTCIFSF